MGRKIGKRGGPVHVSLAFGGRYRSRCCFAFQYQSLCSLQRKIYEGSPTFPLKDKSSSVLILSVCLLCVNIFSSIFNIVSSKYSLNIFNEFDHQKFRVQHLQKKLPGQQW